MCAYPPPGRAELMRHESDGLRPCQGVDSEPGASARENSGARGETGRPRARASRRIVGERADIDGMLCAPGITSFLNK